MKFNLAGAISTGVQAFFKTGNPAAAAGAALVGGFAAGAPAANSGDAIGNMLGFVSGNDPLKLLADRTLAAGRVVVNQ